MMKRTSPAGIHGAKADTLDPDTMSNTELLQQIEILMDAPAETMDTDLIELYLSKLQERTPVMEDYDADAQWKELMDRPLPPAEEHKTAKSQTAHPRPRRVLKWVYTGLAAMLALVITTSAFGTNPIQSVLDWANDAIQVYTNPSGIMELRDPSKEYQSLEEALEDNGIDSSSCPTWVPQDYQLSDVISENFGDMTRYSALYNSSRGELTILIVQTKDMILSFSDEKESGGYIYPNNGVEYYIVSNTETNKAGWQFGGCSYSINGNISEDELITMIDSIHKG